MKDFKSGGGFGARKGGNSFGRRDAGGRDFNRGGGNSFERPAMFQAICAECGQPCEVPFKPSGDRPVYCSNCFKGKEGSSPRQFDSRDSARPNFRDSARPAFNDRKSSGRDEHARPERAPSNGSSFDAQFNQLNAKIDQILRSLGPVASAAPAVKPAPAKTNKFEVVNISQKAIKKPVAVKKAAPKKAKKK